ncbi:hypothetical protein G6F57_020406 [Rhizopus arrhizus]|nr:hypothetical protein G6F57_020406 [Rhizopus arrhizus]
MPRARALRTIPVAPAWPALRSRPARPPSSGAGRAPWATAHSRRRCRRPGGIRARRSGRCSACDNRVRMPWADRYPWSSAGFWTRAPAPRPVDPRAAFQIPARRARSSSGRRGGCRWLPNA